MTLVLVLHCRVRIEGHTFTGFLLFRIQYLNTIGKFSGAIMRRLLVLLLHGLIVLLLVHNFLTLVQINKLGLVTSLLAVIVHVIYISLRYNLSINWFELLRNERDE